MLEYSPESIAGLLISHRQKPVVQKKGNGLFTEFWGRFKKIKYFCKLSVIYSETENPHILDYKYRKPATSCLLGIAAFRFDFLLFYKKEYIHQEGIS